VHVILVHMFKEGLKHTGFRGGNRPKPKLAKVPPNS
jgi:hypothetical protein